MLEFNIRNQEISRIDGFSPAEKSVEYLIAKFNFKTEDWNGATKRAIFRNAKSKVEKDAMLEDDSCTVPWEVLVGSSEIEISVHGIIDTKEITTNVAVFNLNRTLQGGSATQEPSPTVYAQMLKEMQDTKDIAQSVRDDADTGKFNGKDGKDGKDGQNGTGEIDEEQLLKFAIKTTTTPSPFHHITDSANMKVVDFGMEGNTEQETTSGKNYIDMNSFPWLEWDEANNGYKVISQAPDDYAGQKIYLTAGTYVLSGIKRTLSSSAAMSSHVYLEDKTEIAKLSIGTDTNYDGKMYSTNFVIDTDGYYTVGVYGYNNKAPYVNNTLIEYVQLEAGSTATAYEPYTGAQPSPNPDYPQEIVNAGVYNEATGRYEIGCVVWNKNWYTGGDVEVTGSNKTIKLNRPLPIGVYYMSALVSSTDTDDTRCLIVPKGCTGSGAYLTRSASQRTSSYFTLTSECTSMTFYPSNNNGNSAGDSATFKDIQIELLEVTDYTPHASQPFTLTSPVPLTKWDYLTKRDGVWGWSIQAKEYKYSGDEVQLQVNSASDGILYRLYITNAVAKQYSECFCNLFRHNYKKTMGEGYCGYWFSSASFCLRGYNSWIEPYGYIYDSTLDNIANYNNIKAAFKAMLNDKGGIQIWVDMQEEQSFHPLPDEEQELLNNLETYYGVTNLYNDQGCPMWLEYVNDTKLYVDQKLLEIQQAMI